VKETTEDRFGLGLSFSFLGPKTSDCTCFHGYMPRRMRPLLIDTAKVLSLLPLLGRVFVHMIPYVEITLQWWKF
jgi:hypothetical protein